MPHRFHIVDEHTLARRLWLKRAQVLAIFVAGTGCGLWLSATQSGQAIAAAPASDAAQVTADAAGGCAPAVGGATRLRMDCELKSLSRD
ncbi:MAG: hypothetical protein E6R07_04975 [Nevskiaceae bacterium]|nr:MAG: hypothetical protein E6R07_04975 [Nevskiaceae bacterium]